MAGDSARKGALAEIAFESRLREVKRVVGELKALERQAAHRVGKA